MDPLLHYRPYDVIQNDRRYQANSRRTVYANDKLGYDYTARAVR